jgi:hypothetical protein
MKSMSAAALYDSQLLYIHCLYIMEFKYEQAQGQQEAEEKQPVGATG